MSNPIVIYPAAALFNGRETYFNSRLVESLEEKGYKTNFPQRDGFEFDNLTKSLAGKLQTNEISSAVQSIIYFLDMGIFVPESDVVLANLDEPLDEGVVVEASYAKLMGKFVIGLRTDVRSPYGNPDSDLKGMHFFPAYQSNKFISYYMPAKNPKEREEQMSFLIEKIDQTINEECLSHQNRLPDYAIKNPQISPILEGAKLLFGGLSDIHSDSGLEAISSRYLKYEQILKEMVPKIKS